MIPLLTHLYENKVQLNGDKRPTVKCTELNVPGHTAKLRSWKFDEFAYGKPDKPLPTNARGLFSYEDQIVLRGYDKFFSTDEVAATRWSEIEKTTGPYDLTLKQNGCIIFIGVLPDGTLLVSSKHSIGPRETESHSDRGQTWLKRHLASAGRTEGELAARLQGLTAVCELCEDDFEEHILAYPPEKSGLYLHGINYNTEKFKTFPTNEVKSFADEFGFRSNESLQFDMLSSVRSFLEDCARTGTYNGNEVEGFVVRCKLHGDDFFFKYKFDEPYLLFRQWREVTKALINGKEPRYKTHKAITKEYIKFVKPILKDEHFTDKFSNNHGIIKLREDFLARGVDLTDDIDYANDRFILVPIATIGCGKTTIALALQQLFSFGHVQNDNILAKGQFAKDVYESSRIVIADRNNHMYHERESLARDVLKMQKAMDPEIHFVALEFVQDSIKEVTLERVMKRGDNHQSIRAATMRPSEIESIMNGFHKRFQALNINKAPDDCFLDVIKLDPIAGSAVNLRVVIDWLVKKGIVEMPTEDRIDAALAYAMEYKPTIYKKVTSPVIYYGIELKPEEVLKYIDFPHDYQIQPSFHVTLVHKSNKLDLFKRYADCDDEVVVTLRRIAHDGRVMAIVVDIPIPCANAVPHITIGTKDGAKPVEANAMIAGEHQSIEIEGTLTGKIRSY